MLSGPSAEAWLAWVQGKSAMRTAVNHQHIPLPPIITTKALWPLGHSMVTTPAYSITVPSFYIIHWQR